MRAHQRIIRESLVLSHPRAAAATLDGYSIETISRNDACPVILRYEWLATLGRSTLFAGLISPAREIQGVACFGYGPAGNIRQLIGAPACCLERRGLRPLCPKKCRQLFDQWSMQADLPDNRRAAVLRLCRMRANMAGLSGSRLGACGPRA